MENKRHSHPPPGRPAASYQERVQLGVESGPSGAMHAQDHWRVDLAQDWEIGFWSREFGCKEHELRKAVEEVGSNAGDVRAYLASQNQQQRS
jgi:hypothetical protein